MHQRRNSHRSNLNTCADRPSHCRARSGFTLLELLLVLSILVVIGGIAMVNLGTASNDAKNDATRAQIKQIEDSISYYKIRMGSLPDSLEALRDGPSDSAKKAKWTGPIMDDVPKDAWEQDFQYSLNGNSYEIRSGGVDGQINTDDDITAEGS